MSDWSDQAPSPDSPPLNGFGRPARRRGAAGSDAIPRMETVRITAPDLARRQALEKAHRRLTVTAFGFVVLFLAVLVKLSLATVLDPILPLPPGPPIAKLLAPLNHPINKLLPRQRATIVDRNGQILAISLPTVSVYANPRQVTHPIATAMELKRVLPQLNLVRSEKRLELPHVQFVWLERDITPREELAVNRLGIPGVYFLPSEKRDYPMGRMASHVLGGVNVDEQGIAGVEKWFNHRLLTNPTALRLSLDVRVEAIMRDELDKAFTKFKAKRACGIVMNANTGEVLAMVSLPDYDANDISTAPADARFNACVSGVYEPGSTLKLQTLSMGLNYGLIHPWDQFNAKDPIYIGPFVIHDFEDMNRWIALPQVLAYSSNLGAAHIATLVGADRQRAWLRMMGLLNTSPIQLPEAAPPLFHPKSDWRLATTMTVGFGQGIALEPMQMVTGVGAVVTGMLYKPTLLAIPAGEQPVGKRVLKPSTVAVMRKLMRLVITKGIGNNAAVPGYYPGGKTGTSSVVGPHGYYRGDRSDFNISSFIGAFPMYDPKYVIYTMLYEPHGTKKTYGFATGGMVAAPVFSRVIARIAPMLGLLPHTQDASQINAELSIPMRPAVPPGAFALGPWNQYIVKAAQKTPLGWRPDQDQVDDPGGKQPLRARPVARRDTGREARLAPERRGVPARRKPIVRHAANTHAAPASVTG